MKKSLLIIFFLAAFTIFNTTVAAILPPAQKNTEAQIKEVVNEFNTLPRVQKKERVLKVKAIIKQYKTNLKNGENLDDKKLLAIIFAILIPPVGVLLHENGITLKFWISLLLSFVFLFPGLGFLFSLPGIIYSLLVVTDTI